MYANKYWQFSFYIRSQSKFFQGCKNGGQSGAAVILKNNTPRYVLIDYSKLEQNTNADNATVEEVASNILSKHLKAFEELAKWNI